MSRNFAERRSKNFERFLRTKVRRRTGRARIEALNEASHESKPFRYGRPLIEASVLSCDLTERLRRAERGLGSEGTPARAASAGATPGAMVRSPPHRSPL